MDPLTVGEFKARFSEVMDTIRRGKEVVLCFGKKKRKLAVVVPYEKFAEKNRRKIGALEKKASCRITDGFKITDDEFLAL